MSRIDNLVGIIGAGGAAILLAGAFLSFQSWRGERAAATLDVYSGLPEAREAKTWLAQIQSDLSAPRDARMWELEAERIIRANGLSNAKAAQAALEKAQAMAPARPSIRMRQTYLALRQPETAQSFNAYYAKWHQLAPHDTTMQVWRLTIAAAGWDRLDPQSRQMALADSEDLCLRWGRKKTIEIASGGGAAPQLATTLRLERQKNKCPN
jgi:hypothetical protein